MLNRIVCMGRLTSDPELRQTNSGVEVCSFTVAVDRDHKQGDEKVADFIPVVCWRGTAKFVSQYFAKGRMAVVEGSLQTRKYEDKQGNKRTAYEIIAQNVYFGDSKKEQSSSAYAADTSTTVFETTSEEGLPF